MRSGKSFCLTLHWVGIQLKRPSVRMSRLTSSRRLIFERSWKELPVLTRLQKPWESIPLPFIERESGCSFESMLRLKLTLGLLATLIILLLVGIYGVWLFNDLGRAVPNVLRNNYDSIKVCDYMRVVTARVDKNVLTNNHASIKVCHYMRFATARVNPFSPRVDRPAPPYDQTGPVD